jgi:hypothetical protein
MAYTGFPATYPQTYPQSYPQYQQQNNPFIWIQGGVAGAQSYQVAPNNTVILWDSDEQSIYIKSADMQGKPSIRILDYTIRSEAPRTAQNALYGNDTQIPTKEDISALQSQIDSLKQQIEQLGGMANESTLSTDAATAKHKSASKVSAVQTGISG